MTFATSKKNHIIHCFSACYGVSFPRVVWRQVVEAEFKQHEELQVLLLSTEDRKIVEHTSNDSYWGDGGDGSGKNMLGRILMEVREVLRKNDF